MGISYNPFSLKGKTVLITGASSGIGRATAIECSRMGAKCVITGRDSGRLQETLESLEGEGHCQIIADIATQEGIDKLAGESPAVDGLVNNAGVCISLPVSFYKQEAFDYVFQTNAFAPMLIIKAFLKKRKILACGSIVFTSSVAPSAIVAGNGIYSASKAAVTTFMKQCAIELAPLKIRANAVLPGMVETKLIHGGAVSEADMEKDMSYFPLGRYGKPEEIAYGIVYLLSEASAWTTGTSLVIDGGVTI